MSDEPLGPFASALSFSLVLLALAACAPAHTAAPVEPASKTAPSSKASATPEGSAEPEVSVDVGPPGTPHHKLAVERIIADAERLKPTVKTAAAKLFLERARTLPKIA